MFDLIGAIAATAVFAVLVGLLTAPAATPPARIGARLLAALWGGAVVALGAAGVFATGALGRVPGPVLAFAALLGLLLGAWALAPQFRAALLAVPLPALVAANIVRVGGVSFLILAAQDRLSTPFATSAGWGDVATGLMAIPLAWAALRHMERARGALVLWNAFGTLDLVAAILLGALSAPGTPFQLFTDGPGTAAMGDLPWVMIPTLLVPLFLLMHLVIATKLRAAERALPASLAGQGA